LDHGKDSNKNSALFGVFDGHGGREVAMFTESHYEDILKNNKNYKQGYYENALRESFL
jgi:serine/threonine protein phosphatase PrpC